MDQWKWHLGQAGLFFVAGALFSLAVLPSGLGWWLVIVVPAAFLSSGIMLVRGLRAWRQQRRAVAPAVQPERV